MRGFIFCMTLGPLIFMGVLMCFAVVLVLAVSFVSWDAGVISAAWASFLLDFNWAKLRLAWVIGLILTLCFYILHGGVES